MDDKFVEGDVVYGLNLKYRDGTRLRSGPSDSRDNFNGVWFANDCEATVTELGRDPSSGCEFAEIKKRDGDKGWIRVRNLTKSARKAGVTKGVISSEMVTPDEEYVKGVKIWGCGIKEDPAGTAGSKLGKGVQHLISSQWLNAMAEFVAAHYRQCRALVQHGWCGSEGYTWEDGEDEAKVKAARPNKGYDFSYFTNLSNHLFNRADVLGLKSTESLGYFLMATFMVMCGAEVDEFPFRKYTLDERKEQRLSFYRMWLSPTNGPGTCTVRHDDADLAGEFATPDSRRDLLPPIAIERLGINNELSSLKYRDPEEPMRCGFPLSKRIDSLKRHFEGVHRRLYDEDHIIHTLWNFHAIFHVNEVFPSKNDLVDYSCISDRARTGGDGGSKPTGYSPTDSREKIAARPTPPEQVLKLDWNEGVIAPPPSVCDALQRFVAEADGAFLKWYPNLAGGEPLKESLAAYVGGIPENIVITNGSDDALILICQAFLSHPKHDTRATVLAPAPTYEHFCVNAIAASAKLIRLEQPNPFVFDLDFLVTKIEETHPDLVYLVSPNNPTGTECTERDVRSLTNRFPSVRFVVDEAYHEFATIDPATQKPNTCVALARENPNVIVTRTFSKAFCLASVRCGYVVAHPDSVETLRCYYNPKSVNQFAQIAARAALQEFHSYYAPYVRLTNDARLKFIEGLRAGGVDAKSGGAGNFVCIEVPQSRTNELRAELEEKSIYVRDISGRFPGYVRITIGLEMQRVVVAVVEAMQKLSATA